MAKKNKVLGNNPFPVCSSPEEHEDLDNSISLLAATAVLLKATRQARTNGAPWSMVIDTVEVAVNEIEAWFVEHDLVIEE